MVAWRDNLVETEQRRTVIVREPHGPYRGILAAFAFGLCFWAGVGVLIAVLA